MGAIVDQRRHRPRSRGNGESHEVAPIEGGGLDVEPRQPQGAAQHESEGGHHAGATQIRERPTIRQYRWRDSEGNQVRQGVQFSPEVAGRPGEPRHQAIQAVQHDGKGNQQCGQAIIALDGLDQRDQPEEQIYRGQNAGQRGPAPKAALTGYPPAQVAVPLHEFSLPVPMPGRWRPP